MLTVVCWYWRQPNRQVVYKPDHVRIWANMISRNLTIPHRLLCITDREREIDFMPTYPLWTEPEIQNPQWGPNRPQCYRRLKAFSEEMRPILGDRFISMDIDCVITGNLDQIFGRTDDFIINQGTTSQNCYNGSMWMMDTGARRQVWDSFDGMASVNKASRWLGSDQAWIRECLGPFEKTWSIRDGVTSWLRTRRIPKWQLGDTKIVFFQGELKPWEDSAKTEWVEEHYR